MRDTGFGGKLIDVATIIPCPTLRISFLRHTPQLGQARPLVCRVIRPGPIPNRGQADRNLLANCSAKSQCNQTAPPHWQVNGFLMLSRNSRSVQDLDSRLRRNNDQRKRDEIYPQSAGTVRSIAQARSACTFSAITTDNGFVCLISSSKCSVLTFTFRACAA
jgi:hypothetical protein